MVKTAQDVLQQEKQQIAERIASARIYLTRPQQLAACAVAGVSEDTMIRYAAGEVAKVPAGLALAAALESKLS